MRKFETPEPLTPKQKRLALKKIHDKWQAHAAQTKILQSIYRDGFKRIFVRAGRKFGKNEIANYLAWRTSIEKDMGESYIVGPTAAIERKIVWQNLRLQTFGPNFGLTIKNDEMILRFPWGSFIQVDGSRNVEGGRGRQFDITILDEIKDQNPKYYDASYPNLLAKDGVLVLIGTPPKEEETDKYHFFEWEQEAQNSKLWKYYRFTSWDNDRLPGGEQWLSDEKERYIARGERDIWDQEYEVKTVRSKRGIIFPMFSKRHHVRSLDVMQAEFLRAFQVGNVDLYTVSDPGTAVFCTLFIAYNRETSQMYILDEIYETDRYETSATRIWKRVQRKKLELFPEVRVGAWSDIYDEAASWFQVEVLNYFGETVQPTSKRSGQDIMTHVSLLKDAMTVPNCFSVSRKCHNTIAEISNFRDLNQRDKNHSLDNLRYFIEESGYSYQDTADRIILRKDQLIEPRARTIEQDMREWTEEDDPYHAITDFSFEFDDFDQLYGGE